MCPPLQNIHVTLHWEICQLCAWSNRLGNPLPWQSPPNVLFVFFWFQTFTFWGRETNERNLTSRTGNVGRKIPCSAMYNTSAWIAPAEKHYFMCCRCYITCCGGHSIGTFSFFIFLGGGLSACGCQILQRIDTIILCPLQPTDLKILLHFQTCNKWYTIFSKGGHKQLRMKGRGQHYFLNEVLQFQTQ